MSGEAETTVPANEQAAAELEKESEQPTTSGNAEPAEDKPMSKKQMKKLAKLQR